jgi:hypothetical protein
MRRLLHLILLALIVLSAVASWLVFRHLRHPPPLWAITGFHAVLLGLLLLWAMADRNGEEEDPPDPPQ